MSKQWALHKKVLHLVLGLSLGALFCLPFTGQAASVTETQKFLHELRHSWYPYPFPFEGSAEELNKVIDLGFDTVGVCFTAPYNNGNIDFSSLDKAVDLINSRGRLAVIHVTPRFFESDCVSDRLSSGKTVISQWDDPSRYSIVDVFDPNQRAKFTDYIRRCVSRYGRDSRVAAFVVSWGYLCETGFYAGDWWGTGNKSGCECAGYSDCALNEFNSWRKEHSLPPVKNLPMPSAVKQSDDYVCFQRFRCEFLRDVFHRQITAAAKANTTHPVGMFAYISAFPLNYARNWTDAPNADFYRTAGSASSFDISQTLIDSGIGWEDNGLHDGTWNFTAACMQRDEARQIAKGGAFHAMWVKSYEQEKQWEKGLMGKVASFLRTQDIEKHIHRIKPTIALFQPTWAVAAVPAMDDIQKFLPNQEYSVYLSKMVGLVESFGLPYKIVTESDLLEPARLASYQHIIVPMWDLMPSVLGQAEYERLSGDKRVLQVPLMKRPLKRSEFRKMLKSAGIEMLLDFDSEQILAGRTSNLVYNWDNKPIKVRMLDTNQEIELSGYQYVY